MEIPSKQPTKKNNISSKTKLTCVVIVCILVFKLCGGNKEESKSNATKSSSPVVSNPQQDEIKRQIEIATNRKERIEKQFSAWDGSQIQLEKYIKEIMNDPDSYQHVETTYKDMGDYLIINTKFRGNNSFGGKVVNYMRAKVDLDGNILEIYKE